jgi:phosphosulfolactate synthase (CoM biosynthesis protein A)
MTEIFQAKIVDITMSEGGFLVNQNLLPEQVAGLVQELESAHLSHVEICNGMGIGTFRKGGPGLYDDKVLLEAARKAAPKLTYCIYVPPYPYSLLEMDRLMDLFELARVKVNLGEVSHGFDHIKKLKSHNKKVLAQILRVHLSSPRDIADIAKQLEDVGADIISITDNFGSMSAEDVKRYIEEIKGHSKIPLGFQGRNNTWRATHNSIAALDAGAEWLDASLLGMGRGAGMTPLEILVSLLHRKGLRKDIHLEAITLAAKWHALSALHRIPMVTYMDLLFAKHKIDYYAPPLLESLAHILDMDSEKFLLSLKDKVQRKGQIQDSDLREYLAKEKLDYDVVLQYLKTGMIPNHDKDL